ncbi:aminoacyl-tRNA hydrolase [SAR86 cluster bacterium]|nr:aminoacyl-tRNA hydrolase [SAR86 cluster bacterium]
MNKFLIAGLGNPGSRYSKTRHNAGTDFVELLNKIKDISPREVKSLKGHLSSIEISGVEVNILIPSVFMNHSGHSLKPTIKKLNIPLEKVLIIHDDLDLPSGACKLKDGGGDGGHNGLKSIVESLGGKNNFKRMRLGIGHPGNSKLVNKYVIQKGSPDERKERKDAIKQGLNIIDLIINDQWDIALNKLHTK